MRCFIIIAPAVLAGWAIIRILLGVPARLVLVDDTPTVVSSGRPAPPGLKPRGMYEPRLRRPPELPHQKPTTYDEWCSGAYGKRPSTLGSPVGPKFFDVYEEGRKNPTYAEAELMRINALGDEATLHQRRHAELSARHPED